MKAKERYSYGWTNSQGVFGESTMKLLSTVHCVDEESLKEKYHAFKKMLPPDQCIQMEGDFLKIYQLKENSSSAHYQALIASMHDTKVKVMSEVLKKGFKK